MRKRNGIVFLLAGIIALSSSGCHVIAAYVGDSINVSEFTDRSGQKETEGPEESIEEEESTEPEETTEEEESSEISAESRDSSAYTEEEIYEKLENSQQENDQESEEGENLTVDVETQVQEVRDIYWEIQNNLEALQQEDGGAVVRYLDSDGHIRKIVAPKGAYYDEEISEKYNAEYYYEIDQNQYYLRFMFIYGNGEEYRFYFDRNRDCFRYIGADGIVHDYQPPLEALEEITDLYPFSMYGQLEIAWAMGG